MHLAAAAAERDGNRLALADEAAELREEVHVPGGPPLLSVGDPLQARRLLQRDGLADRRVLGRAEVGSARSLGRHVRADLLERGRTEQAADVIGTERRARRCRHGDLLS